MLLYLAGAGAGAALSVCDARCARDVARLFLLELSRVTEGDPTSTGWCRRCVSCGGIIDEPLDRPCWWHPRGCPTWEYRCTAVAAHVLHRLAVIDGVTPGDSAMLRLEATLDDLGSDSRPPHPDEVYTLLRSRLS